MTLLALETSSYLPMVWNTPYTRGIWNLIQAHGGSGATGVIHRDSIREAKGYFAGIYAKNTDSDQWKIDPAARARRLADCLSESELACLPFPSTAFAVILGGWIGQKFGNYLNYTRHCGFLYCDLVDALERSLPPRQLLLRLADMIDERSQELTRVFDRHLAADTVTLTSPSKYPYWGRIYDGPANASIELRIREDLFPWDKEVLPTRDAYHYLMIRQVSPRPDLMIIADGNYRKNVRQAGLPVDLKLLLAKSWHPVVRSGKDTRRARRST
jgi:hypothetical protein